MMHSSSLTTQPPASDAATDLNPVLKAALASLDVQLEAELNRYRRSRQGHTTPSQRLTMTSAAAKSRSLDLITIKPQATAPTPAMSPEALATPAYPAPDSTAPSATASAAIPPLFSHQSPTTAPDPKAALMVQTAIAAQSAAGPAPALAIATTSPQPEEQPQGYLASSEYLLEELAQAELNRSQAPIAPTGFAAQLFTPLGVGSLLLLLASSLGLGYVLSNPEAIAHLNAWVRRSPTTAEAPNAANPNLAISPLADSAQPDLATEEFVNLDLGTLSTLPGNTNPAPSLANGNPSGVEPFRPDATGSAAATALAPAPTGALSPSSATPTAPAASSPAPASRTEVPRPAPLPNHAAPTTPASSSASEIASAPAPAAPATNTTVASAPTPTADYYYVVADYQGDPSLNSARAAVGDAYVRNFEDGAHIQLGAFNDETAAQTLIQELAAQGINAEIKAPD